MRKRTKSCRSFRLTLEALEDRCLPSGNPPIAVDDVYSGLHDRTLVSPFSVLDNDTADKGATLTAKLYAAPSEGSLNFKPDGTFSYDPKMHFVGSVAFQYRAFDGSNYSDPATVTLNLTDQAPTASDLGPLTVQHDSTLIGIDLAGSGSDADGDSLTARIVTPPSQGDLWQDSDSGQWTYAPWMGHAGPDSAQFVVNDGVADSTIATICFTITNPITLTNPGNQINYIGDSVFMALNASDASGGTLTYDVTGLPSGLVVDRENGFVFGVIGDGTDSGSPYTVTVTASDSTYSASQTFTWAVSPELGSETGFEVNGVSGQITLQLGSVLNNILLGTITAYSGATPPPPYEVSIAWGDGETSVSDDGVSALSLVEDPNAPGVVDVYGSHSYAQSGTYQPIIAVMQNGTAVASGNTCSINVVAAHLIVTPVQGLGATQQIEMGTLLLGTFSDTNPSTIPGPYQVMVDWGDEGDPEPAEGIVQSNPDGTHSVCGGHVYGLAGSYTVTIMVVGPDGAEESATLVIQVAGNSFQAQELSFQAVKGQPVTNVALVSFATSAVPGNQDELTVTIDWGDDTPVDSSTGALVPDGNGNFIVQGSHTYADDGDFDVTVRVTMPDGTVLVLPSAAHVVSATIWADGAVVDAGVGAELDGTTLATFVVGDRNTTADDYVAMVDWGDGTGLTSALVTGSGGVFKVTAPHTYSSPGQYNVSVAISGPHGVSATAQSMAYVVNDPFAVEAEFLTRWTGSPLASAVIGTINTTNTSASLSDFAVAVDWGDGTTSSLDDGTSDLSLQPVEGIPGQFNVLASHAYPEAGTYDFNLVVTNGPRSRTATGNVLVAEPGEADTGADGEPLLPDAGAFTPGAPGSAIQYFPLSLGLFINQAPNPAPANTYTLQNGEPSAVEFTSPHSGVFPVSPILPGIALSPAIRLNEHGASLRLNAIDASMIRGLSPSELRNFLLFLQGLGNVGATIREHPNRPPVNVQGNALALFVGRVWSWRDGEATARVFAAMPGFSAQYLPRTAREVLQRPVNLRAIAQQVTGQNAALTSTDVTELMAVLEGVDEPGEGGDDTAAVVAAALAAPAAPAAATWTPLTTARATQLWRAVPANAQLIQEQNLTARSVSQRTGIAVERALRAVLPNDRAVPGPYRSHRREEEINERQDVDPDGVTSLQVNQIIHRIGTSGIPVTETRAINYRESTFIEVKLWSGRFTLSHERYQALGMIDVLSRSSAHRDGYPAALLLVTAADTVIGRALLREATRQRVLVFQARLLENQNATTQGGPNIRIDTPVLLNPSVLIGSTISAVVPPLTVPPPAAVRWP